MTPAPTNSMLEKQPREEAIDKRAEDENDSGRCSPYQYTWYIISFVYNS